METSKIPSKSLGMERLISPSGNNNNGFLEVLKQKVDVNVQKNDEEGINRNDKSEVLVPLGIISKNKSTVSDLLIRHPEYGKRCWKIVHSEENRAKPYTRIQPGTPIYLNPETLEIVWNSPGRPVETDQIIAGNIDLKASTQISDENQTDEDQNDKFSQELLKSVQMYIGKPYNEMDCYELIVSGLNDAGIKYWGKGGLKEHLTSEAVEDGLPYNAYLSGEGLVSASGNNLYSRHINEVDDPVFEAKKTIEEIQSYSKKGLILSFSTPTRGHTGILSYKNSGWTFINSGIMDHHINTPFKRKEVGEENLNDEIINWFNLASKRNESLQISLGQLDKTKLSAFIINKSMTRNNV